MHPLSNEKKRILVTGGAGFVGSHLVSVLLERNYCVTVLDNFSATYDPSIKRFNSDKHLGNAKYILIEGDIRDSVKVADSFNSDPFYAVVHLAAMTQVRDSLINPSLYLDVNVVGTQKLIDEIVKSGCRRFIFTSSSVVYGVRALEPLLETDCVNRPISPYAASKVAGELLSHSAHHIYGLDVVCLRLFNIFGPRQNPRTAMHKFMRLIDNDQSIELYGDGSSKRDYVHVTDIVSGIVSSIEADLGGYEIINLACAQPISLNEVVRQLELLLNKKAKISYRDPFVEEMPFTYANISKARQLLGYQPSISFQDGISQLVNWYKSEKLKSEDL
jgi:UDP-glucuronate 4-epimerase